MNWERANEERTDLDQQGGIRLSKQFNCKQCGDCCGPLYLLRSQLETLKSAIKAMSVETIDRLKRQYREPLTCILLDTDTKRCSVYHFRPAVCRQYGQIRELQCPNNKGLSLKSGRMQTEKIIKRTFAGILSETIGWKELEE